MPSPSSSPSPGASPGEALWKPHDTSAHIAAGDRQAVKEAALAFRRRTNKAAPEVAHQQGDLQPEAGGGGSGSGGGSGGGGGGGGGSGSGSGLGQVAAVATAAMAQARWQRACQAKALTALQDGHEMLLGLLGRHCTCAWYRRAVESDHGLLDELWGSVARALSHVARTRRRLQRGASARHPTRLGTEGSTPGGEASVSLDQWLQSGRSSAGSVESLPARARTPSPGRDEAGAAVEFVEAEQRRLSLVESLSLDAAFGHQWTAPPSDHAGSAGAAGSAARSSHLNLPPPPLNRPTPKLAHRVRQSDGLGGFRDERSFPEETSGVSPTGPLRGPAAIMEDFFAPADGTVQRPQPVGARPLERSLDDAAAATATESAEGSGERQEVGLTDLTDLAAASAGTIAAAAPIEALDAVAALDAVPYASHEQLPPQPPDDSLASAAGGTGAAAATEAAGSSARLSTGQETAGPIERYFIHRANEAAVAVAARPSRWNHLLRDLLPTSAHAAKAATKLQAHARAAQARRRLNHASEVGTEAAAEGEAEADPDRTVESHSAVTLARAAVARARVAVDEPGGGDANSGGAAVAVEAPADGGSEISEIGVMVSPSLTPDGGASLPPAAAFQGGSTLARLFSLPSSGSRALASRKESIDPASPDPSAATRGAAGSLSVNEPKPTTTATAAAAAAPAAQASLPEPPRCCYSYAGVCSPNPGASASSSSPVPDPGTSAAMAEAAADSDSDSDGEVQPMPDSVWDSVRDCWIPRPDAEHEEPLSIAQELALMRLVTHATLFGLLGPDTSHVYGTPTAAAWRSPSAPHLPSHLLACDEAQGGGAADRVGVGVVVCLGPDLLDLAAMGCWLPRRGAVGCRSDLALFVCGGAEGASRCSTADLLKGLPNDAADGGGDVLRQRVVQFARDGGLPKMAAARDRGLPQTSTWPHDSALPPVQAPRP